VKEVIGPAARKRGRTFATGSRGGGRRSGAAGGERDACARGVGLVTRVHELPDIVETAWSGFPGSRTRRQQLIGLRIACSAQSISMTDDRIRAAGRGVVATKQRRVCPRGSACPVLALSLPYGHKKPHGVARRSGVRRPRGMLAMTGKFVTTAWWQSRPRCLDHT